MKQLTEYITEAKRLKGDLSDSVQLWWSRKYRKNEADDFNPDVTFEDIYTAILEAPIVTTKKTPGKDLGKLVWSSGDSDAYQRQQIYRKLGNILDIKDVNGPQGGVDYALFDIKVKETKQSKDDLLKQFNDEFDAFAKSQSGKKMKYDNAERTSYSGNQDLEWMPIMRFAKINNEYFKDDAFQTKLEKFADEVNYKIK